MLASSELPVLAGSTPGGGDSLPARGLESTTAGGTCALRAGLAGELKGLRESPKPVKSSAGSGTKLPPVLRGVVGCVAREERREANGETSD
jgi:hypothetical protein